jgi:hypothetical protein
MTNDFQQHLSQITNQPKIRYLDISNRDLNGTADLKEFTALKSLNSYSNKFESLDWLLTLPNKDKLERINFFGNQLKEIDLPALLSNFPNLQYINLENNPLSARNLSSLTTAQFGRLVDGIKDKKIRINSWKGTLLLDLLEHARSLVSSGHSGHHSHLQVLKTLVNEKETKPLKEIKPVKTEPQPQVPNNNALYFMGGLVLIAAAVLGIGYWWGKSKKKEFDW